MTTDPDELEAAETRRGGAKSPEAFRTISEVAADLDLPQHVLRFWETRFPQVRPLKRGGSRRYYRPQDIEILRRIRQLLYDEGYTIKGVQRLLKEPGARAAMRDPVGRSAGSEATRPARPGQPFVPPEIEPGAATATAPAPAREAPRAAGDRRAELGGLLEELKQARALLRR